MADSTILFSRPLLMGVALITLGATAAAAQGGGAPPTQAPPPATQPQSGAGTVRLAFVHSQRVLRDMPGYAKAESTWTKEAGEAQNQGRRMQAAFDSTVAAYQQASAMMTPSARTAREKTLQAQADSLRTRLQAMEERINARERELLTPMQTKLQGVIDAMRGELSFTMIIDLDNPASANIISFDKSLDISDRVARRVMQN
ncbi:MAG TPA: OmpH family outer membrane protein [Gemmatimonadales bacterium]|nr:OmpH family outer membrane protein [Gemmatimonadales bacterium]